MMATALLDNVLVVIRSVGERTEAACRSLACEQVAEANVVVLSERPFGAAVRKTFEMGIERGLDWTLALDADVLLRPHAVRDMLAAMKVQSDDFFFANFSIADKLCGVVRYGGGHLYRTSLLEKGLTCAGQDIDEHERPESLVRARMAIAGYPSYQIHGLVVGLHGFEQSYRDVYRTAFVQWLKHPAEEIGPCLAAWQRLAGEDPDFEVALAAARAAEADGGTAVIDDRLFPRSVEEIGGLSGIEEKPPPAADMLPGSEVSRRLGEFSPFPECLKGEDTIRAARMFLGIRPTLRQRVQTAVREYGALQVPLVACGYILERAGTRIIQAARWRSSR